MIERVAIVQNGAGIHCRPASIILKEIMGYKGEITVRSEAGSCRLASVMELLTMCLEKGTEVTLSVHGADEGTVVARLVELFEREYDFPAP